MSVNFVGLNSSFDSGSLIQQLVQFETQSKIQPLEQKKLDLRFEKSILSNLESRVGSLRTTLDIKNIGNSSTALFPNEVSSSDSDDEFLKVTASASAVTQNFDVNVSQLATNTVKKSAADLSTGITTATVINTAALKNEAILTGGELTINGETRTYTVDPAIDDIDSIITFLNGYAGVTASLTGGKIALTGVTNLGSSGDDSNLLFTLGLDNAQILGGNVSGLQNLDAPKASSTLASMGINGTNITLNGESITFDPATDTLKTLVNKINITPNAKVTASYDALNGKFTLTNEDTGSLSLTTSSTDSNIITQLQLTDEILGNNAEFSISNINGGSTLVSNNNRVTGIIDGITLDLNKVTSSAVSVNVSKDKSSYSARIEDYLSDVNSIISTLDNNDSQLSRRFSRNIRNVISNFASAATDTYRSGIEIGIKTSLDGEGNFIGYTLDKTIFETALDDNPDAVNAVLFGKTGTDISALSDGTSGVFVQLNDLMDTYVDPDVPTEGILRSISESLDSQINGIDDSIERAEDRIEALETRLTRQFAQLDVITAEFQRQQAAVSSLFNSQ